MGKGRRSQLGSVSGKGFIDLTLHVSGQPNDIFGMQVGAGQQMFGGVGQRLVSHDDNQPAPEEANDLRMARERACKIL